MTDHPVDFFTNPNAHTESGNGYLDFSPKALRMKKTVESLFAEEMAKHPPGQTPAISCQILLDGGFQGMGSLSTTLHGTLRFMAIGRAQGSAVEVAAEHFFDYEDLKLVVVPRGQVAQAPANDRRIITG